MHTHNAIEYLWFVRDFIEPRAPGSLLSDRSDVRNHIGDELCIKEHFTVSPHCRMPITHICLFAARSQIGEERHL